MLKAKIGCKHENKRNIIDHAKEYYNQKVGNSQFLLIEPWGWPLYFWWKLEVILKQ